MTNRVELEVRRVGEHWTAGIRVGESKLLRAHETRNEAVMWALNQAQAALLASDTHGEAA